MALGIQKKILLKHYNFKMKLISWRRPIVYNILINLLCRYAVKYVHIWLIC